jgi:benzoylformate decarboxylase
MTSTPSKLATALVRDAALEVLRRHGCTTIFANPGSTEIPLLIDLPPDFRFVLALHEASVVGMATGWSLARLEPALVNLHTAAGLGNAVGALATARTNRAPLLVVVGQQDRRHLAFEPFLAGKLHGLAGEYPVWTHQPARPEDVPGALARGWHEAQAGRGPAIVIVPMDDWLAPIAQELELAAPKLVRRSSAVDPAAIAELAELIGKASAPALVAGAGADNPDAWAALATLAEILDCPVWQESFGARAGFPQGNPRFAGHLPAGRTRLRQTLAGHDVVVAVGCPVFRQHNYEPGPLVDAGTLLAVVTEDPGEAHCSPADIAVIAPVGPACRELIAQLGKRPRAASASGAGPQPPPVRASRKPLASQARRLMLPRESLQTLSERLPPDAIVIEETPSSRIEFETCLPALKPFSQLHAANGGLGFAMPAAIGIRMADPTRPVVAVLGDGSALYTIQALWSAAHYDCGALFIVLANGRYAVMDHLAEVLGGGASVPWPTFEEVSLSGIARAFGCAAERIEDHDQLVRILDRIFPDLASRTDPLLLEIMVDS